MLLFSVFVLLRGHNEPGGGFIGGLIAASAFAIHGIAFGVPTVRRALHFHPMAISGFGLLLAALSGLPSLAFGVPFLTGHGPRWTFRRQRRSLDGDGLRHRRLSRRGRLDHLDRAGARRPGGRLMEAVFSLLVGAVLRRRHLSDPVEAHHPHRARHRRLRQRGQPVDLHGRADHARGRADHPGRPRPPARPGRQSAAAGVDPDRDRDLVFVLRLRPGARLSRLSGDSASTTRPACASPNRGTSACRRWVTEPDGGIYGHEHARRACSPAPVAAGRLAGDRAGRRLRSPSARCF